MFLFIAGSTGSQINPDDIYTFRNVALISVVGVGGLSAIVFHIVIKPTEKSVNRVNIECGSFLVL